MFCAAHRGGVSSLDGGEGEAEGGERGTDLLDLVELVDTLACAGRLPGFGRRVVHGGEADEVEVGDEEEERGEMTSGRCGGRSSVLL